MLDIRGFMGRISRTPSESPENPKFSVAGTRKVERVILSDWTMDLTLVTSNNYSPAKNHSDCLLVGYISNRIEIIRLIQERGEQCSDLSSDSDLMKLLFDIYGKEAFRIFHGNYVALLLENRSILLISGKTPGASLYYHFNKNHELFFATELKAFPRHLRKMKQFEELDLEELDADPSLTWLESVFRILPGTFLYFDLENPPSVTQYHSVWGSIDKMDEGEAADELSKSLRKVMRSHGGKKVACLVSGGLDSSIVALISREVFKEVILYTLGNESNNEFTYVDIISRHLGLESRRIEFSEFGFLKSFIEVVLLMEHCFSIFLEYVVPVHIAYKEMHSEDTIVSGYGADIIFGGFAREQDETKNIADLVINEYSTSCWANEAVQSLGLSLGKIIIYPYFDSHLVEIALSIDPHLKHKGGIEKYILRKAFLSELPPMIAWRKKLGIHISTGCQSLLSKLLKKNGSSGGRPDKDRLAFDILQLGLEGGLDAEEIYKKLQARGFS